MSSIWIIKSNMCFMQRNKQDIETYKNISIHLITWEISSSCMHAVPTRNTTIDHHGGWRNIIIIHNAWCMHATLYMLLGLNWWLLYIKFLCTSLITHFWKDYIYAETSVTLFWMHVKASCTDPHYPSTYPKSDRGQQKAMLSPFNIMLQYQQIYG